MDVSLFRLVVSSLAALCGLCIVGIILSNAMGHEANPTLGAIASMAAGSLVGILVTPTALASSKIQKNPNDSPPPSSNGDQRK